jgi:hypothetical protein
MTTRVKVPGRGWAYTGAILGGLVSIAANVAHSFIPPAGTATTYRTPEPGAIASAIVWPVFLFIAVEIFARVRWQRGVAWLLARWAGMLPVAGLAALVSYRHLSGLLAHYGEEPVVYFMGPLAVDGLMVMATGALLATGRQRHPAPQAAVHTPLSAAVAAPAVIVDGGHAAASSTPAPPMMAAAAPDPAGSPSSSTPAVTPAVLAQRITPPRPTTPATSGTVTASGNRTATRPKPSKKAIPPASRPAPSATDSPVTAPDRASQTSPVVPPDVLARVRVEVDKYRTEHGTTISPGQLAVRLRVTSEQAQQALAVLNLAQTSPTEPVRTVNGTPPAKATR